MNIEEKLNQHLEDYSEFKQIYTLDREEQRGHNETLARELSLRNKLLDDRDAKMDEFIQTMESLTDLATGFKGLGMLKKPAIVLIAIVLGIVSLIGGLKTILMWFVTK